MGEKISNAEYRSRPAISKSSLFKLTKSPMHFKYAMDNPTDNDSPALLFGRAVHKFILEPNDFKNEFAVAPNVDRRTKAGKEEWAKFVEETDGKDVITAEMMDGIIDMAHRIKENPIAVRLLTGRHEESFFWTDERTGIDCKCRPDCLLEIDGHKIIVDYKTCSNAETEAFMKDAIKYGYDLQAAMYIEGMQHNEPGEYSFIFVCQEKTEPYALNIVQADDLFIKEGRVLMNDLLDIYKECTETGNWYDYTGPNGDINNLSLPNWLAKMFE